MKKLLRPAGLLSLALSLCFFAGCISVSVNTPAETTASNVASAPQAAEVSKYYFSVSVNGKQGVVNERGQVVLPFEYADINIIYQDETPAAIFAVPAVVKMGKQESSYTGKLYGLDGITVFEDNCNFAYTISDGLILFMDSNNKYGVITYDGKEVVPAQYDYIAMCGENNIAAVSGDIYSVLNRNVDVNIYDKNGSLKTSGKLNFVSAYSDIIVITDDMGNKFGIANIQLQEIVAPVWDEISVAGGGLCVVRSGEKYGLIDTLGNEVIPVKYNYIDMRNYAGILYDPDNTETIYFTAQGDDGVYIFDRNGKQLFYSKQFRYAYIENNIMIAQDLSSKTHYINAKGEDIVPPAEYMYTDKSGFIFCTSDQNCICYTSQGEKLPLPEAQSISAVSTDRFIYVTKDNWLYGLCGSDGSIILPAQYSYLYPYGEKGEFLLFYETDKSGRSSAGLIDPNDGHIILRGFDTLNSLRGGLFYAKKGPVSGLVDIYGSWIWRTSDYETLMD